MKYLCKFKNAKGERREVLVSLSPDEIAELGEQDAVFGKACALRRAYRDMPPGFLHEPVERVTLN